MSHELPCKRNSSRNQDPAVDYFYSAATHRSRGALWPIFAPARRLYYTPAISSIMNLNDGSFQVIPELVCTRVTNWEMRFRTYLPVGTKNTEFGEKQNNYRVELRIRRYF